jgi:hypothetical protein
MPDEFRPKAGDFKGQKLPYPAKQSDMDRPPDSDLSNYRAAGRHRHRNWERCGRLLG